MVECDLLSKTSTLMLKQKCCMQGHCPGKLIFCRAQDKEEFLLPLCTKFI